MKFVNGMEFENGEWCKILNRWTKGGNDRIYINNENRKSCGYVDLKTGDVHWASGVYASMPGAAEFVAAILDLEF